MVGNPGNRQDAARARDRRRSESAVLQHFGLRFRRDVRRRGRGARARHVRAGEEALAVHRVHRRDRRGRPPARRGPGRRQRRARADAEPAPRRNGRLRSELRRHRDRGDQPSRRARPGAAAPGRFDRQVVVPLPDIRGREQILQVHMRKVPVAPDVRPDILARGTPGFSGADLANLVNEAALFAARGNKRLVDMDDFERAKDKIIMGAERRSIVMPEHERKNTAYHEAGHAVVARLLPRTDPVHKVTIIPRGRALGVTMQLPAEDRYSMDREMILQNIAVLFGGRIAEEDLHAPDDDRRLQRLRACDRDGAQHGHALRHVRRARPDGLRRERRRSLPRPLDHDPQERVGSDVAEGRCRDPPHHRPAVRGRAQADRGQPRQGRSDGESAARVGNHRRRADQRHHGRPAAASAEACGGACAASAARQHADADADWRRHRKPDAARR